MRSPFVPTEAERAWRFQRPRPFPAVRPRPRVDPLTGEPFPGDRTPFRSAESRRAPPRAALRTAQHHAPEGRATTRSSPSTAHPLAPDSVRLDWSLGARTRLLVRYTQDSWRTDHPACGSALGERPVPGRGRELGPAGRSLLVQLSRDIGTAASTRSSSLGQATASTSPRRTSPDLSGRDQRCHSTVFPAALKYGGLDHAHPSLVGRPGPRLRLPRERVSLEQPSWTSSRFRTTTPACSARHLLKVGVLYSFNRKNEVAGDRLGRGPPVRLRTGVGGYAPPRATSSLICSSGMTFVYYERSANPYVQLRWQDLEAYLSDSWRVSPRLTVDVGLRASYLGNPYTANDAITNFDPAVFDPALGSDPCNGLLQVPGKDPCGEAGFQGERPVPTGRSSRTGCRRSPAGRGLDVFGNGKTAIRAVSDSSSCGSPLPEPPARHNPPFASFVFGIRALDTSVEPCEGCLSPSAGSPSWGREVEGLVPNNWQWSLTLEQEVWRNAIVEVSYVGSRGLHMFRGVDVNVVPSGDPNGNGVPDRLDYVRSFGDSASAASLRPFGVFGDTSIQLATRAAAPSTTACRPSCAAASVMVRSSKRPTRSLGSSATNPRRDTFQASGQRSGEPGPRPWPPAAFPQAPLQRQPGAGASASSRTDRRS